MEENYKHIELLDRFMRGMTSPEEEKELLEWFRCPHSRDEIVEHYRHFWAKASGQELSAETQGRMFHQIKTRMKALEEAGGKAEERTLPRKKNAPRWLSYAAAVLLCVGLGTGSNLLMRHISRPAPKDYIVSADKGQRASLTLPDGTKVWLNSHSKLSYNTEYGTEERIVNLSGEAYFEVAKDKEHRFVVKTGEMEVEALGTTFNVKAYNEDSDFVATLFEGSIRAGTMDSSIVLTPNQHVSLDRRNKSLTVGLSENASYAKMWRNNELAFESEKLENIAVFLNRMYNVQVVFKSEKIKRYRFSGVIKNNSLDNVIEIISLTAPITYESTGDTIVLGEKQ